MNLTSPDPTVYDEDRPRRPTDGCWQWGDPGDKRVTPVPVHAVINWKTLSPGDELAATYVMYSKATNETCFPAGPYVFDGSVFVGREGEEHRMCLAVSITVDETGTIAVNTQTPTPP